MMHFVWEETFESEIWNYGIYPNIAYSSLGRLKVYDGNEAILLPAPAYEIIESARARRIAAEKVSDPLFSSGG